MGWDAELHMHEHSVYDNRDMVYEPDVDVVQWFK